ncbi:hypothetical protein ACE1B6_25405 [Aerosakkonemataceae cyanobacterium BLCC-F154]|uniref:Uncharacterized protein n=1 Tax=Floridaenema fluviatile BLCC-F154 TaxID=3153640 RepID=A0ABV4YIE1_9CYAN
MSQLAELNSRSSGLIELRFDRLKLFEPVIGQYKDLGIEFHGAIALKPSNPEFFPQSGDVVLMPQGHKMLIATNFKYPVTSVRALVCGSGSIVLTTYDINGTLLDRTSKPADFPPIVSPATESKLHPTWLQSEQRGITRIELHSCTPFTLSHFCFLGMA